MIKDAYWDELGIAWRAVHPETEIIIPRLQERLRRQSVLITGSVVAGLLFGFAGALVGAYSVWRGWTIGLGNFVARGIVLVAVSAIPAVAAVRLLPVMSGDHAKALPEMINLTIARAERQLVAIRLGLLTCAVWAALEVAGMAFRAYSRRPPAMPLVLELAVLAILAIVALGFFFYERHIDKTRKKFRYLKDTLTGGSA
ncbi:MAG: hypothetical protein H0U98_14285 [Alphaproteobacteria bacterium]|nr:hypothetical protein [Alphaproteobacteria bacterium]